MGRGGLPTGILARGAKLYVKVRLAPGKWSPPMATRLPIEDVEGAVAFRDQLQARVDAGFTPDGPLTVAGFAKRWLKDRESHASHGDDERNLTRHVLPEIGALRMEDVRPRHIASMVKALRRKKKLVQVGLKKWKPGAEPLAPSTVINAISVCRSMFNDAVVDEVIRTSPVVFKKGVRPKKSDKDPEWRASAVFTRAELEQIVSDDRIPQDRRVLYALGFFTASRFGEAAAMRWRLYDPTLKPLGRITIARSFNSKTKREKSTKTDSPRKVPVHPVLAKILAEWKLGGFEKFIGRPPKADDLIIPSRLGKHRTNNPALKRFHEDLQRIGLRVRRQHDARRTFRTIALDDGGNPSRVPWITHGRPGGVDGDYDEPPWHSLCEVVEGMRLRLRNREPAKLGAVGAISDRETMQITEQGETDHD